MEDGGGFPWDQIRPPLANFGNGLTGTVARVSQTVTVDDDADFQMRRARVQNVLLLQTVLTYIQTALLMFSCHVHLVQIRLHSGPSFTSEVSLGTVELIIAIFGGKP